MDFASYIRTCNRGTIKFKHTAVYAVHGIFRCKRLFARADNAVAPCGNILQASVFSATGLAVSVSEGVDDQRRRKAFFI